MVRLARIAFPIALLLFAGFFFGGRLGWWSDDYWHCRRDAATDQVQELVMRRGFFLRPLFYAVVPAITTSLWHHPGAAHAIQLASHGLVVIMLWRLLLLLGLGPRSSGAAAMLFMVYPAQFETLFWVAALPTSLSSALMLGVMMLAVRIARGQVPMWVIAVLPVMTFAACCLNEQPASVAGVLPVLAWAAAGAPRVETSRWRRRARMLAPGVLCILAGVVYVAIMRATLHRAPHGVRGASDSFIALDRSWERTVYFGDVLWRRLVMKNWGSGALREGCSQVVDTGAAGLAAVGAVAALGAWWALARGRATGGPESQLPAHPRFGWRMTALGVAVFAVGWFPILIVAAYEPDSRCRYSPNVGLTLLVAAAFDAIGRRASRATGVIIAARLALVPVLLLWSVMLIGAQSGFRSRWTLDRAQGAELRRLIPNPVPFTMFLPLSVDERALRTGSPVLDTHFRSVWEFPWSAMVFLPRVYQRSDLRCGYWRHWTPRVPVRGGDEAGIHYDDPNFGGPRFDVLPDRTHLIPWDRAVLFTIGKDHTLRVATRVVLMQAGQADIAIEIPQARGLPEYEVRLPRP